MQEINNLRDVCISLAVIIVTLSAFIAFVLQAALEFGMRSFVNNFSLLTWTRVRRKAIFGNDKNVPKEFRLRILLKAFGVSMSPLISLPYQQLCSVLGQAIPRTLESPDPPEQFALFTANSIDEFERDKKDLFRIRSFNQGDTNAFPNEQDATLAKIRLSSNATRALDDLQAQMGSFVPRAEYLMSLTLIIAVIGYAYAFRRIYPNEFRIGSLMLNIDTPSEVSISLFVTAGVAVLAPFFQRVLDRFFSIR